MALASNKYKDVAFSSNFRYQQVALRGHLDFTLGSDPFYNEVYLNIPHGLGYKPYFRLWLQFPGSTRIYQIETGTQTYGIVGAYQIEGVGSDTSNITVLVTSYGASAGIGKLYWRIYKDPQ